jgi:ribonuclease J
MHGITGGDDAYLMEEAQDVLTSAIRRAVSKQEASVRDIRKVARDSVLQLLWDRIKQRPMVIVNILEV